MGQELFSYRVNTAEDLGVVEGLYIIQITMTITTKEAQGHNTRDRTQHALGLMVVEVVEAQTQNTNPTSN